MAESSVTEVLQAGCEVLVIQLGAQHLVIRRLKAECDTLRKANATLLAEKNSAQGRIEQLQKEIEELKIEIADLRLQPQF